MDQPEDSNKATAAKNAFHNAPLITREALIADHVTALQIVPPCLAFAVVMDNAGNPFDADCLTVLRPAGRNADQVNMRTVGYAAMCELKRWGGGINIHQKEDGTLRLVSTYSSRASELGHSAPVERILAGALPRETVRGASHKGWQEPGSNVAGHDAVSFGSSKWDSRRSAIAHAERYAGANAPSGYDIGAYIANLHKLLAFHDELMATVAAQNSGASPRHCPAPRSLTPHRARRR